MASFEIFKLEQAVELGNIIFGNDPATPAPSAETL
jgi:hypothetical protein